MRSFVVFSLLALFGTAMPTGAVELVSIAHDGAFLAGGSKLVAASADGRHVLWSTRAQNVLPTPDRNEHLDDLYLRDREQGEITLVSRNALGIQFLSSAIGQDMTPDTRYVLFRSAARNVIPGQTGLGERLYLKDRTSGRIEVVDLTFDGQPGNKPPLDASISDDGRWVAFASVATDLVEAPVDGISIYLRDRQAGTTTLVSRTLEGRGADRCELPKISGDGRFVVYTSPARTLVPFDFGNDEDVFVWDRTTGSTERANVGPGGVEARGGYGLGDQGVPSRNGSVIAFRSTADNLAGFDINDFTDVFVRLRAGERTELVSRGVAGIDLGRWSSEPALDASGRYVAFISIAQSFAPNSPDDDSQVYVKDRVTGAVERVSEVDGVPENNDADQVLLSDDGAWVFFATVSSNLVPGDPSNTPDVFAAPNPLVAGGAP